MKKITLGEVRAITRELEAFAGKAKPRGCPICRNGDQHIAQVARSAGYKANEVAAFIANRNGYELGEDAVYRHWYRCKGEQVA